MPVLDFAFDSVDDRQLDLEVNARPVGRLNLDALHNAADHLVVPGEYDLGSDWENSLDVTHLNHALLLAGRVGLGALLLLFLQNLDEPACVAVIHPLQQRDVVDKKAERIAPGEVFHRLGVDLAAEVSAEVIPDTAVI